MKKNWLRGLLLGVSMALLLSGGVALAADVYIRVDQPCFECLDVTLTEVENLILIPEENLVELTIGGGDPLSEEICWRVSDPVEEYWAMDCADMGAWPDPCHIGLFVTCEGLMGFYGTDCGPQKAFAANGIPSHYGQWTGIVFDQVADEPVSRDEVSFLFAEDCYAAMFVPEPGSILLLGSGLAGLAGYATLRWRARE
ncbi:MAG: PEP-CTERM sorting domain-containing protein [Anaerolineae bacterium]